jgi:hypothetical protein
VARVAAPQYMLSTVPLVQRAANLAR